MDRWNQYGTWSEFERRRDSLVPGRVEAWIFAILVLSLLGGRMFYCLSEPGSVQACMQSGMHRILSISSHAAALLLGIWAGPRIGLRLRRYRLGYVAGTLIVVAASASLTWLGFSITTSLRRRFRLRRAHSPA